MAAKCFTSALQSHWKTTVIRRVAIQETAVSRHHGSQLRNPSNSSCIRALSYWGIEGGPLTVLPLCRETLVFRTANGSFFFPVRLYISLIYHIYMWLYNSVIYYIYIYGYISAIYIWYIYIWLISNMRQIRAKLCTLKGF